MSSIKIESYIIDNRAYRNIKKYIKRNGYRNYIVNTWNICLDTRNELFDMKLIWVKGDDPEFIKFMDKLTEMSEYFDFFDKSTSLLVRVSPCGNLEALEDFINTNKLWHFIEKIRTYIRMSLIRVTEKKVTFHPKIISMNILASFNTFWNIQEHERSLVMAKAYGWLTPLGLIHFQKKIRYRYTHVVIYLLLDYYRKWRRHRNIRVLNLFDLCSLRLAMFDPRYYQFDQCELPNLIHSEFCHIVECEKKLNPKYEFSTVKYFVEQGIKSVPPTVAEFFSTYVSNYSENFQESDLTSTGQTYLVFVHEYLSLYGNELYEDFIIDFIQKRPFLQFSVLCHRQATTPNLLRKILDLQNMFSMSINVDFPVVEFEPSIYAIKLQIDNPIGLTFIGKSENNYLANYIAWLKTFKSSRQITLCIFCIVADYTVFNRLDVNEIKFERNEINTKNISELSQIEQTVSTRYIWEKVTLAKNVEVLKMIQAFPMVQELDIIQDENTFETIFRFIEDMFQTLNCTELEFDGDMITFNITITEPPEMELKLNNYNEPNKIVLNQFVFGINSEQNKIEMYDKKSKNVVDLYGIMFQAEDSTESYDFYQ